MNDLIVFGDSFAQSLPGNWVDRLAKLRNLNVRNYAIGGSCLEYSFIKLLDHVKKEKFKQGDIVIFVLTHPNRLDLEEHITKDISSAYKINHSKSIKTLNDSDFFIKYNNNRSKDLIANKHILYLSFLKALATENFKTKFLAIPAYKEVQDSLLLTNTENFLFLNKTVLMEISDYECDFLGLNGEALQNIFGTDPRTNHMTNLNLEELSLAVNDVIDTCDINYFYKKRFKKNIVCERVRTIDDVYLHYVETGLIDKTRIDDLNNIIDTNKKRKWFLF